MITNNKESKTCQKYNKKKWTKEVLHMQRSPDCYVMEYPSYISYILAKVSPPQAPLARVCYETLQFTECNVCNIIVIVWCMWTEPVVNLLVLKAHDLHADTDLKKLA